MKNIHPQDFKVQTKKFNEATNGRYKVETHEGRTHLVNKETGKRLNSDELFTNRAELYFFMLGVTMALDGKVI